MNHIGNRIRELRREAGLTQEKLAGYLSVSYQTISKWETGVNTPDLAYLVPLSRLLHTTTDDLLGNTSFPKEADERKKKLEAAWKEAWEDKQEGERLIAAARALTEAYPENPLYWWRLVYGERMRAFELCSGCCAKEQTVLFEQALAHYNMVIEDGNEYWKNEALRDASNVLRHLNRMEEARQYAERLPKGELRNMSLRECLPFEEGLTMTQDMLHSAMLKFLNELILLINPRDFRQSKCILDVLENMIPDGNYLHFHSYLLTAHEHYAQYYLHENRPDDAMDSMKKAWVHVQKAEQYNSVHAEHKFTAPLLNRVSVRSWPSRFSAIETFRFELKKPWTEPLRKREDFCALAAECGVNLNISE